MVPAISVQSGHRHQGTITMRATIVVTTEDAATLEAHPSLGTRAEL